MRAKRPTSGRKIGTGFVRVDAKRALAKLRDFQLADPHEYLTEFARGLRAHGATRLIVDWDADDVWLAWWGHPIKSDVLLSVLDSLVSPETRSSRGLRPIARGINTALRLRPSFIDVHDLRAAEYVRFASGDESPSGTAHDGPPQDTTPCVEGADGLLQVRGRFGLDVVSRFLRQRWPSSAGATIELEALDGDDIPEAVTRLAECSVRLRTEKSTSSLWFRKARLDQAKDLLRVSMPSGAGYLAVSTKEQTPESCWVVAEQGLSVSQSQLMLEGERLGQFSPPCLIAYIDLAHVPTNASRKNVRWDSAQMRQIHEAAGARLSELFSEWAQAITLESAHPQHQTKRGQALEAGPLRRAALAFVAHYVQGSHWRDRLPRLPRVARPLLSVPLARGPTGELLPLTEFHSDARHLDEAFHERLPKLVPYMPIVLLALEGSAEEQLIDPVEQSTTMLIQSAEESRDAHARWLAQPQKEPRVDPTETWVVRTIDDPLHALSGEVALLPPGRLLLRPYQRNGALVLMREGRTVGALRLPFPLPFDACVESWKFSVGPLYDSVLPGPLLDAAVHIVHERAVAAVEEVLMDCSNASAHGQPFPFSKAVELLEVVMKERGELSEGLMDSRCLLIVEHPHRVSHRCIRWLMQQTKDIVVMEEVGAVAEDRIGLFVEDARASMDWLRALPNRNLMVRLRDGNGPEAQSEATPDSPIGGFLDAFADETTPTSLSTSAMSQAFGGEYVPPAARVVGTPAPATSSPPPSPRDAKSIDFVTTPDEYNRPEETPAPTRPGSFLSATSSTGPTYPEPAPTPRAATAESEPPKRTDHLPNALERDLESALRRLGHDVVCGSKPRLRHVRIQDRRVVHLPGANARLNELEHAKGIERTRRLGLWVLHIATLLSHAQGVWPADQRKAIRGVLRDQLRHHALPPTT